MKKHPKEHRFVHFFSKKLLIFTAITCLIASALYIYRFSHSSTKQIEARKDGFYPKMVTVRVGEKVTFVNKKSVPMWPASDLHPEHSIYPSFDPKKEIKPGESWTFQFTKTGEWGFHDHIYSFHRGKIVVKSASLLNQAPLPQCKENEKTADPACIEYIIKKTILEKGVPAAFDIMEEYHKMNPLLTQSCHSFTHTIGETTYELFARKKPITLTPKTGYCAYGFYHGFLERLLQETKDLKKAGEFCDYVGKQLAESSPDAKLQCFHGIGHGTATMHNPKEGDENAILGPALKLCEKVSTTKEELYRCASGAFNAIAIYYMSGEYSLPFDKTDPFRLCREQPEKYKEPCYGNMNTVLAAITNGDFAAAGSLIEKIEEDTYAISSIRYLGALMATEYSNRLTVMVDACRSMQERLGIACIQGIAHGLLEHGTPGKEYESALIFCKNTYITEYEKNICYKYVAQYLSSIYSRDKVKTVCSTIPSEFQSWCKL
jgi:plastocyanin